jgi:hypothetical protein
MQHDGHQQLLVRIVLVGLYEEPERPANAVDYIKRYMGAPAGIDVEALRVEVEQLRAENAQLHATVTELNGKVGSLTYFAFLVVSFIIITDSNTFISCIAWRQQLNAPARL